MAARKRQTSALQEPVPEQEPERTPGLQGDRRSGQARGQQTRADILDVARRFFSEHGYHSTGIADIQQATGLTKGAFYHHFRSKEDLALAVLEQALFDYQEHFIRPALQHASARARIEALLDATAKLNSTPEWCNCRMMVTLSAELTSGDDRLHEQVRQMHLGMLELWRDLLTEAREAGEIARDVDPETAAQWIMSSIAGLLLARKMNVSTVPLDQSIALLKRTLLAQPSATAEEAEED